MPAVTIPDSASTAILVANYDRTLLAITNSHATSNLHFSFGGTATTDDAFIAAKGTLTLSGERVYKGAINAISSSGDITVKYSVLNAGT